MTRHFVLIGDPVAHSISPILYRTAFAFLGVEGSYESVHLPRAEASQLPTLMRAAARDGGGGNVTLPHKEEAAAAVEEATAAVARSGACNCFWLNEGGRLAGDNTDVEGFRRAVEESPGVALSGSRLLVLGAGGAARAVVTASVDAGARRVDVWGRTPARAAAVAALAVGSGTEARAIDSSTAVAGEYDLVVNATPLGLSARDALPLRLDRERVGAAFDLVYGPEGTAWTRHARRIGVPAADGLGMLVYQAAAALQRWFPDAELPEKAILVMRDAAREELRGRR